MKIKPPEAQVGKAGVPGEAGELPGEAGEPAGGGTNDVLNYVRTEFSMSRT